MKLPNGYGSVVFLGKKRRRPWAARLTVGWGENKKQIYKYLSYHEKRTDALAALIEYNKNPYDLDRVSVTFAEVFEAWAARRFSELEKSTAKNYKSIYNKCTKLYNVPFRDIKTAHLQEIVDENEAASRAGLLKGLFSHLYSYAIKNDIVEKDYSQFVEIPTHSPTKKKTTFSKKEVATLWENVGVPYVDLILILLYTGMRISELLGINIKDIDLDGGYMIGGIKTEAGKNRIIPIHADIMPLVKAQFSENKKYLFPALRGGKLGYREFRKNFFIPLMDQFKMKHTLHETRHTFISQADRCGINPTILKKIVGHANGDITLHYTHKETAELLEEIKKFKY